MVNPVNIQSWGIYHSLREAHAVAEYLNALREHTVGHYFHSLRAGLLCVDLGHSRGLCSTDLAVVGNAGLLHDIGKKDISLELLEKPGRLTGEEMKRVKWHVRLGYIALEGFENDDVRKVIVMHHEFKKEGYPRKGSDRRTRKREECERRNSDERICMLAQILAVSDIYDSLAHRRSYKPALPEEEIKRILGEEFTGDPSHIAEVLQRA